MLQAQVLLVLFLIKPQLQQDTAGTLAGTIDSSSTITLTAGGAGTSATGQFVSEISIK